MNFLSFLAFAVYAAEAIISPIPDGLPQVVPTITKPSISFSQIQNPIPSPTPKPQVLGAQTEVPVRQAKRKTYTIAVLGDSMVDTLGPGVPHLKNALSSRYPGVTFSILNYGVGGTNIEYGIERITNSYAYLGNQIVSLASVSPDIVVIESFAYNPFPDTNGGVDRHWLALAKALDTIKQNLPHANVVIAATIAPNSLTFGDGAPGIAFTPQDKQERTSIIKSYLESTVKFAHSQHLPLADAYHASKDGNGDGILRYINGGDHIHYSDPGRALVAAKIADAITSNHLLE